MKIVFFGTPEFATASLRNLVENGYDVAAVVTMPDKIGGRGHKVIESDVKKYAVAHGIPVMQPEKLRDPEFIARLKAVGADLFIVIAFRMLPEMVWGMPPMGTFNLHASLLPDFRGAAPINHAIIAGRKETGVTTFLISHEIDTGGILMSASTPIYPEDNAGTLHDRLMELGAEVTLRTVNGLDNGSLRPVPQPDGIFAPAPKIFKHTCRINFNLPSANVVDFIRGHAPYPAAWSVMRENNGREVEVKITGACHASDRIAVPQDACPGKIFTAGRHMYTVTADGAIEITALQPAGKRVMEASALLAGYHPDLFIAPIKDDLPAK